MVSKGRKLDMSLRRRPPTRAQKKRILIDLAISNPCFELWALLHFQEQRAHIERHDAQSRLAVHMPGYDKALDYPKMRDTYRAAVKRSVALDENAARIGRPGANPTTGVHRLTEQIRTE